MIKSFDRSVNKSCSERQSVAQEYTVLYIYYIGIGIGIDQIYIPNLSPMVVGAGRWCYNLIDQEGLQKESFLFSFNQNNYDQN